MSTARTLAELDEKSKQTSRSHKLFSWGLDQATRLYNIVPWAPSWLPLNNSNYTGFAFPQTTRLKGHWLTGRHSFMVAKNGQGFSEEVLLASQLAEKDPLGRCYFSAGFISPTWVFVITQAGDWDQVLLHNSDKLWRGQVNTVTDNEFGKDNIMGLPRNSEWRTARIELLRTLHKDGALENLCNKMEKILEEYVKELPNKEVNLEELFGKL